MTNKSAIVCILEDILKQHEKVNPSVEAKS